MAGADITIRQSSTEDLCRGKARRIGVHQCGGTTSITRMAPDLIDIIGFHTGTAGNTVTE